MQEQESHYEEQSSYIESPFKSQISVLTRMNPSHVTEEDREVDIALNGPDVSEIGDSYEIIRSSSSDQYTPIPA